MAKRIPEMIAPYPQNFVLNVLRLRGSQDDFGVYSVYGWSADAERGCEYLLSRLTETERAFVIQKYREGMAGLELAEAIGVPESRLPRIRDDINKKSVTLSLINYVENGYEGELRRQRKLRELFPESTPLSKLLGGYEDSYFQRQLRDVGLVTIGDVLDKGKKAFSKAANMKLINIRALFISMRGAGYNTFRDGTYLEDCLGAKKDSNFHEKLIATIRAAFNRGYTEKQITDIYHEVSENR